MSGAKGETAIHTVTFHPPEGESWLSSARHRDLRLEMLAAIADVVGLLEGGGPIVLPAGFLRVPSSEACDALAGALRKLSRRSEVALVFGIDVGAEEGWAPLQSPPASFAFACDGGRPILWPAQQVRGVAPAERRCIEIGGVRAGVVIGAEVFNSSLRKELDRARPDAIFVLTHVGPTERWGTALEGLRAIAPTFVTGDWLEEGVPSWVHPPAGWLRTDAGGAAGVTLHRFERLPVRLAPDGGRARTAED